ncbi:MAG: type III-A CRISPR-associated protein Csm2 [Bacteroidota bacterium]
MSRIKSNFRPRDAFKTEWIATKIDNDCIDYLENMGFYLTDKKDEKSRFPGRRAVTTSQLRNIFGELKRIETLATEGWEKVDEAFQMLRPTIAYASARVLTRSRESRITDLREVLERAHSAVSNQAEDTQKVESFKRFLKFFEGILAYHKVYGGRD